MTTTSFSNPSTPDWRASQISAMPPAASRFRSWYLPKRSLTRTPPVYLRRLPLMVCAFPATILTWYVLWNEKFLLSRTTR